MGRRTGFTLIELMLVVAIILVVVAVTTPTFVRSIRGNRLRTAARTVVKAGRYARSMAVLEQRNMTVTFDLDRAEVSVAAIAPVLVHPGAGREPEDAAPGTGGPLVLQDAPPTNGAAGTGEARLSRRLDAVTIESVRIGDEEKEHREGRCAVSYGSNGRCTPYKVKVVDEDGASITVEVDALSSVETEYEGGA